MITVISGTNRKNSYTRAMSGWICEYMKSQNIEHQLVDLRELPNDIFNHDVYWNAPDSFKPFQERILNCDGILVVTPEYNGSFPGALKYFIDILKFPESLHKIPAAFVGVAAGRFGALRSIEQLEMIFQYREAHIFGSRVMFPGVDKKMNEDKTEITDDKLRGMLEKLIINFQDYCNRLK